MDRKIVIKNCDQCPNSKHKGGFGKISFIPFCIKYLKELPYTVEVGKTGFTYASSTGVIPEWCPLEKN